MEYEVTLAQMLAARERRALRQRELLAGQPSALICFTMNIAGPVKNSPLIRRGFALGNRYLKERLDSLKAEYSYFEDLNELTGDEAYYLVSMEPLYLKKITSEVEDGSGLGRLFDMDVLRPDGEKAGRDEIGLPPRRCLICGGPAKECARSRAHSVAELKRCTERILSHAADEADWNDSASLAIRALLYEAVTTPKPGLVDCANNGSHTDMDIFTFMDSASALWPYFARCTQIGQETASLPAPETMARLRPAGRKAEADMFAATKGVNTHKGAVFSMGTACAALGRLPRELWNQPDRILDECAAMAKGLTASDFKGLTEETAHTVGQKLYLKHRIAGARGQLEAGFPAVREAGLPVLKEGLARGLGFHEAGSAALLALIAASTDTNLIARGGIGLWQETVSQLKELLADNPYPGKEAIEKLDCSFIEKNLSPGGSADLLAICYFLYFLSGQACPNGSGFRAAGANIRHGGSRLFEYGPGNEA